MDDQQFRQLLSRFGFSWEGYRKVRRGVKKRVTRHMLQTNCRTMQAYFSLLHEDRKTRQHFDCLMTVSIKGGVVKNDASSCLAFADHLEPVSDNCCYYAEHNIVYNRIRGACSRSASKIPPEPPFSKGGNM